MAKRELAQLGKALPVSGFQVERVCFDGAME